MRCEKCGNDYEHAFEVILAGETHTFDSFECAIAALAPVCGNCGVRIIGHGVRHNDAVFCCQHCARAVHVTAGS